MQSSEGTVHIIGAGLAGLSAAVQLTGSGRAIVIHEAAAVPGGRCRSYYDQSTGMLIDNGTHLVLSGNKAALSFAEVVGSVSGLQAPVDAAFPFFDFVSKEKWTLQFNDGRIPWWIFDKGSRVPKTAAIDYLPITRLLWASSDKSVGEVVDCTGPLFERLLEPFLLAALNIAPREGSAKLAGAIIRETLALGGSACRPLLAQDGIGNVFVEPAVAYLQERGISLLLQDELLAICSVGGRISQLDFTQNSVKLGPNDVAILAVPPYVVSNLIPGLRVPSSFRGIVNAHFRVAPPSGLPPMLGVIHGTCEWIFALPGRISVTISDASRLFDMPRAELAELIWRDVAAVTGLPDTLPPWQIVRERRATFAATPEQNAMRPAAETAWSNLFLAGDWTATGLPATIESAVRSGYHAADLVAQSVRAAA